MNWRQDGPKIWEGANPYFIWGIMVTRKISPYHCDSAEEKSEAQVLFQEPISSRNTSDTLESI
jgi:hypothetical protein